MNGICRTLNLRSAHDISELYLEILIILDDLVNKGILKRVGTTGKYTYYTLKSNGQSNGQSKHDKHANLLKKKAR
ncbi:MAG: hypothetical protein KAT65_06455 [Methanophagales archaeon]|nr:hypothetical protein [Methanophagales archaeon]